MISEQRPEPTFGIVRVTPGVKFLGTPHRILQPLSVALRRLINRRDDNYLTSIPRQGVNKLDVLAARDTLQFIEAFRPVLDKVTAFASSLRFTMASRKASLAADALQIYSIAKGVARDPGSAQVASLVANLKRDLGRRGRPRPKPTVPPVTPPPPKVALP